MKTNAELTNELRFEIVLSGHEFDGSLNLGLVLLKDRGAPFALDIESTIGYTDYDGDTPIYRLVNTFAPLKDTIECYDEFNEWDFEQSLGELLTAKITATTCLYHSQSFDETTLTDRTMERIQAMHLTNLERSFKIPVKHIDELD